MRFPGLRPSLLAFAGLATILFSASFLQGVEVRAWKRERAIERLESVRTADPARVDPALEGELVRIDGLASTEEVLADPLFDVEARALLLERRVETFQWQELKTKKGLQHRRRWAPRVIPSDGFAEPQGHENPSEPRLPPHLEVSRDVRVGAYVLSSNLVDSIHDRELLPLESLEAVPEDLRPEVILQDGTLFLGTDPDDPEIGDTRISFLVVRPLEVKLLGKQSGDTLAPFGDENGPRYLVIKTGNAPLFSNVDSVRPWQIWLFRGLSVAGLALGVGLLCRALPAALRPGSAMVFWMGPSLGAGVAAATWQTYSPQMAIGLAALALALLALALLSLRRSPTRPPTARSG